MGICSSCLGRNRHPSQDADETDPLLDEQQAQYGAISDGDVAQPDEEELRREREAFERITTEATDNMIDVLHPGNAELSQRFAHARHEGSTSRTPSPDEAPDNTTEAEKEDEESAWLKSIQAANAELITIKGLESGSLVMDTSQLRTEPPTSAPRRSTKGKLPA